MLLFLIKAGGMRDLPLLQCLLTKLLFIAKVPPQTHQDSVVGSSYVPLVKLWATWQRRSICRRASGGCCSRRLRRKSRLGENISVSPPELVVCLEIFTNFAPLKTYTFS